MLGDEFRFLISDQHNNLFETSQLVQSEGYLCSFLKQSLKFLRDSKLS